jgi:hypothetical protein
LVNTSDYHFVLVLFLIGTGVWTMPPPFYSLYLFIYLAGPCTYQAGALPLEPHSQPFLL